MMRHLKHFTPWQRVLPGRKVFEVPRGELLSGRRSRIILGLGGAQVVRLGVG